MTAKVCQTKGYRSGKRLLKALLGVSLTIIAVSSGCLDRPVAIVEPQTSNAFLEQVPTGGVDKIDLLFVIDNSISMADKQEILSKAVHRLLGRLINPLCVSNDDSTPAIAVDGPHTPCPDGYKKEFRAIDDIHIGVISSSLGDHGARDICNPAKEPTSDDGAHLIGTVRPEVSSYQGLGFLAWDPQQRKEPPGEDGLSELVAAFSNMVTAAGEKGCGYEATLEAWYRFLVDPEPPLEVVVESNIAKVQGVDAVVLEQRAKFLRPDSLLSIVMLSDENDCSVVDGGYGWLVGTGTQQFRMARSTAACAQDPNNPCCRSCALEEVVPPENCQPLALDPECAKGVQHEPSGDHPNLRCYDQKRRFGTDFLYPVSRYVEGLLSPTIKNRAGQPVENPIYRASAETGVFGRDRNLVFLAGIIGVPWQDIATPESLDGAELSYLRATELAQLDRWRMILGDPANGIAPSDPLMIETPEPRQGVHPITGEALGPATSTDPAANSINGHEYHNVNPTTGVAFNDDLQYACIFPLDGSRSCTETGCDCSLPNVPRNKPLCNPPGGGPAGTTQYFAKAYPGMRQLQVLHDLGKNSIVASICPKVTDAQRDLDPSFGYNPAVNAIIEQLKNTLNLERCLPRELVPDPTTELVPCAVVEATLEDSCDCASRSGRKQTTVQQRDERLAEAVLGQLRKSGFCSDSSSARSCDRLCLCEIEQRNDAACLEDPEPDEDQAGYCYIDEAKHIGNPAFVSACPATGRRLLRFIGRDTPRIGSTTLIACAGATFRSADADAGQ